MSYFQKKPVVIEARQFDASPANANDIISWAACYGVEILCEHDGAESHVLRIPTLEGDHSAIPGDWIIKGVKDEFYPCKPDIFAATYQNADSANAAPFDLLSHLRRQREWSERTFGPGDRTLGIVDHIDKELAEIIANPGDVTEWMDVVILALDGAWRMGFGPEEIVSALAAKQAKNEGRNWPDWRTAEPGKAIEHIQGGAE